MAYPKKMKGWRTVTVDDIKYFWKFIPGAKCSVLNVRPSSSSGSCLEVRLNDWVDPWINSDLGNSAVNYPAVITPSFVADAIRFALANDWKPEAKTSPPAIEFRDKMFTYCAQAAKE